MRNADIDNLTADRAKAIGILLVVLGHVIRGVANAGLLPTDSIWWHVDRAIYAFHMPLFFFVSGLFLRPRVLAKGYADLVAASALALLGPAVVWSYLQYGMQFAAAGLVNTRIGLTDWLLAPFPPRQQFWFLLSLFQLTVIVGAVLALPRWRSALVLLMLIALGSMALHFEQRLDGLSWLISPGALVNAPFFLAGIVVGSGRVRLPRLPAWAALGLLVLALGIAISTTTSALADLPLAFACVYALIVLSDRLPRPQTGTTVPNWQRWLCFVGANTMIIFLAHVIAGAAVRVLLVKLGIMQPTLHIAIGVIAGMALPLLLVPLGLRLQRRDSRLARILLPVRAGAVYLQTPGVQIPAQAARPDGTQPGGVAPGVEMQRP